VHNTHHVLSLCYTGQVWCGSLHHAQGPAGTSPLKAHDWSSVLVNTESLESYFLNHIVRPILDAAADVLLAPASPRR
jgi:hypothetical protein